MRNLLATATGDAREWPVVSANLDAVPARAAVRLRDLPVQVRWLLVGFAFSAVGSGLTLPYLYVYLVEVRHFETATVGWLFAWMGLLGFAVAMPLGTAIDRLGPRPVMIVGLVIEAVGTGCIGWADSVPEGFAVASLVVIGTAGLWPASTALLTRMVSEPVRERLYAVNFMTLNAGLGIGGLISSLVIDVNSVASFQRLYLIDALTFGVHILVLLALPRGTGSVAATGAPEVGAARAEQPVASWSVVLRDRALVRFTAISVLVLTVGYAQLEAGFAAYTVTVAGVPPRVLGWAYAGNTLAIVVGQLVVLRFIAGRRRTTLLTLCSLGWGLAWAVVAASGLTAGWSAALAVVVGMTVFGLSETLWAPVAPALVNSLAREDLRGRYNALQGMAWTMGGVIGPAMAGLLIGHGLAAVWVVLVVGGQVLGAVLFRMLRSRLTDDQDGVGR